MTSGTAVADDESWFDDWIQTEIEIEVVSSPPDLVSGDDARVVISLPFFVSRGSIRILLNGEDVGDAFSTASDKSVLKGVLNGLALGESVLEVDKATVLL